MNRVAGFTMDFLWSYLEEIINYLWVTNWVKPIGVNGNNWAIPFNVLIPLQHSSWVIEKCFYWLKEKFRRNVQNLLLYNEMPEQHFCNGFSEKPCVSFVLKKLQYFTIPVPTNLKSYHNSSHKQQYRSQTTNKTYLRCSKWLPQYPEQLFFFRWRANVLFAKRQLCQI